MSNGQADRTAGPQPTTLEALGNRLAGSVPRRPRGYLPRTDLLAELNRLSSGVQAVTGVPGAGTTQLAAAHARARLAEGWRLVAWVHAENAGTLQAGLAAVADAVGLSDGATKQDPGEASRMLLHRLETDGEHCLLVFDGVEDPDVLRPFLPADGMTRVLITGHGEWDFGPNVLVDVFSEEQALMFLGAQTGLADDAAAATLAAELGYLPLALSQAAAVIARHHLEYKTYLERLRALAAKEHSASRGVTPTVMLSLDTVQEVDPAGVCTTLMGIMSVLSSAGARRDLLHAAGQAGVLATGGRKVAAAQVDLALDQLADLSLLNFSLDGQTIFVHPLVSQVIRDELARSQRTTMMCLRAASPLDARAQALAGSGDRPAVRDVAQQVTALANAAPPEADEQLARALLRLRFLALYHLIELGDSAAHAVAFGEALTADLEQIVGANHPDTMNARNSLAAAYQAANRPAEAITVFEQTLVARQRQLGPDHPDTLTSQNNLAAAYEDAGRAAEATLLFELTLAARERLLGPDHPSTLNSCGNLAASYREVGRVAEAIPLFEQTLAGRNKNLGIDHPDTMSSRNNLAAAYREAGRVADAIPLVEQSLAVCERLLGADHPKTLATRNNLGLAYKEADLALDPD